MEMHQIQYFLAAAEELNFTRAAERCNVSQPTMTRAIKLLEDGLGGPLFNRERTRTHLTELGRIMLPYLRQIWEQASEARRRAHDFASTEKATLRLGLMCTIAPRQLIELVRSYGAKNPGVELQIVDATAANLAAALDAGNLDVAIFCLPDGFADGHHAMPLYRERFVIAVGAKNPLARQAAIRVRDLEGASYLDRIHCEYGEHAERAFAMQGVSDRTVYSSDRDDWILAMAAAGLGYAFIPEQCAEHPGVVARPLVEPEIWREINLVTVRGRPHSAPLGALVSEASRQFRRASAPSAAAPAPEDACTLGQSGETS